MHGMGAGMPGMPPYFGAPQFPPGYPPAHFHSAPGSASPFGSPLAHAHGVHGMYSPQGAYPHSAPFGTSSASLGSSAPSLQYDPSFAGVPSPMSPQMASQPPPPMPPAPPRSLMGQGLPPPDASGAAAPPPDPPPAYEAEAPPPPEPAAEEEEAKPELSVAPWIGTNHRLLLLSSSRTEGHPDFLAHAAPYIAAFLGVPAPGSGAPEPPRRLRALFVPYAAVPPCEASWDEFEKRVAYAVHPLAVDVVSAHRAPTAAEQLQAGGVWDVVLVGGGNTFLLLSLLQTCGLLLPIRHAVAAGTPYIGWSAGANVAGWAIHTTNDMPIVAPPLGLGALSLVPVCLNPHYAPGRHPGTMGETREGRIAEFLSVAPPGTRVVGLPEGSALRRDGLFLTIVGEKGAVMFSRDGPPEGDAIAVGEDLSGTIMEGVVAEGGHVLADDAAAATRASPNAPAPPAADAPAADADVAAAPEAPAVDPA